MKILRCDRCGRNWYPKTPTSELRPFVRPVSFGFTTGPYTTPAPLEFDLCAFCYDEVREFILNNDKTLGAAGPETAQRERGGDCEPRQANGSPAEAEVGASVTDGSPCDFTGQRQASPSGDRPEGSPLTSSHDSADPAGTRSPASFPIVPIDGKSLFFLHLGTCTECRTVALGDADCYRCGERMQGWDLEARSV